MKQHVQPKKWKMAVIVWIAIVPLIFTIMPPFKSYFQKLVKALTLKNPSSRILYEFGAKKTPSKLLGVLNYLKGS